MMEKSTKTREIDGFEAARRAILDHCLALAPFDGWTGRMLADAIRAANIDAATAKAAFPRGVRDVIRYWSAVTDETMAEAMTSPGFADQRIREKVTGAVLARLDALRADKEAVRRSAALMAAPSMGPLAAKLVWASADTIWRGLGDKSTDFNFYTKRAILSGVLTSTMARWLADGSDDESATRAFLDARIENVMQIEKVKAQARKIGIDPAAPIGWFAKMRYPAGR